MTERTINAERVEQLIDVFGSFDENVKKIEQAFGVHITNRNTELKVTAEDEEAVDAGARAIEALLSLAAKGEEIDDQKVRYLIDLVRAGKEEQVTKMAKDVVCVTAKGRPVKAKTIGQQTYLQKHDHHRRRPCRYGQDVPGRCAGGRGFPGKGSQPHHPDASRRRSGRAAGLPPGRFAEQGRPVSAAVIRRAV